MTVICHLHQAGWWGRMGVICQLHETGWRLSVSYMRQDDGYLSVASGMVTGISQLHEAGWRVSVSYMRQNGGYLSDTWGRMAGICQLLEETGDCLSVTWGRMANVCRVCVYVYSVAWSWMVVVYQLYKTGLLLFAGSVCTQLLEVSGCL